MNESLSTAELRARSRSGSHATPRCRLHPACAGAFAGLCSGLLAGALGGCIGALIDDVGVPDGGRMLQAALLGAPVLGALASLAGAPVGLLAASRGRLASYLWPAAATFWAGLVATTEAARGDWLSAARTFILGTALLATLLALLDRVRNWLWKRRRLVLASVLGWLALCLAGEAYSRLRPRSFTPLAPAPSGPVVQLRSAPMPTALAYIARHHFFVAFDPAEGHWHRWELWQYANSGGLSWGHVHRDLLGPDSDVGGDAPRVEREWHGADARALLAVLRRPGEYPHRNTYVAVPGPDCNTYVAWVLREAGVSADLDPRALGKDYLGPVGVARTTTGTGVQAESALLGVKVGVQDGVELHFVNFTGGIDTWPPAIKTPLGRVGFDE
jgi:hypothetical protein